VLHREGWYAPEARLAGVEKLVEALARIARETAPAAA
jgi:hypothetical protein